MCFISCWSILFLGEPLRFTPWGLVSGLFWVPGGVSGIYAIRNAGIAMAVGTWSSIIVLTSFLWGIMIFEEKVQSIQGAVGAVSMLILGLLGMAFFSGAKRKEDIVIDDTMDKLTEEKDVESVEDEKRPIKVRLRADETQNVNQNDDDAFDEEGVRKRQKTNPKMKRTRSKVPLESAEESQRSSIKTAPKSVPLTSLEIESLLQSSTDGVVAEEKIALLEKKNTITLFDGGMILTRRQAGLLAAAFNGLWGGTNLVPLHFAAQAGYGGPSYVISFACGSLIVTFSLWTIRFCYEAYRLDCDIGAAYNALPSFHIRQMWFQGMLSGFLYSMGNFMSIISVTYLGQGVGYSFTQFSMLVSGLWGIFKFGEIKGRRRIMNWFFSAMTAVIGVLWLCYEHSS